MYNLSDGSLSAGWENIGDSGTGTFIQSGGTNAISGDLYLGSNFGASGTYSLSGSGQLLAANEYIGVSGIGTLTQSGGINAISYLELGSNSGASGTYNLSGGSLSAGNENIGNSGTGTFIQSGGTNAISDELYLASDSSAQRQVQPQRWVVGCVQRVHWQFR